MKLVDLTGKRFGRLVVVSRAGSMYGNIASWSCRCDCGGSVITVAMSLTHGRTKSCGCIRMNDHTVRTYELAHMQVRNAKGRAAEHACVDCGGTAREWSYVGGDPDEVECFRRGCIYSFKPSYYVPRCSSCHKRHDGRTRATRSA